MATFFGVEVLFTVDKKTIGNLNDSSGDPQCALGLSECTVCTLDCLGRGQKGRVYALRGPNRHRLMELGLTNGTEIEVSRQAAFGGPLEIRVRSYRLSLRRDEAATIQVETEATR